MKLFVSYRRCDSQDIAARIAERLAGQPGIHEVFLDVEGIDPGADFAARIDAALAESDACLILVGHDWVGADPQGGAPRIAAGGDFVRYEVAAALRSGKRVIPVLLNGASMPPADSLPEDVRALTRRNAVFVRHTSFNQDLELLADAIFERQPRGTLARFLRRHPLLRACATAVGGMAAAGALLIGLAAIHAELTGGLALEETLGGAGMVWLLIIVILGLGGALPLWWLRRR